MGMEGDDRRWGLESQCHDVPNSRQCRDAAVERGWRDDDRRWATNTSRRSIIAIIMRAS